MFEQELAELAELMVGLDWRFAKTIPEWPHFYIVRGPEIEDVYVRLFRAIRTHGQDRKFGPFKNRYLELGDGWKYWAMTKLEQVSKIINRDQQLDPATFTRKNTVVTKAPSGKPQTAA